MTRGLNNKNPGNLEYGPFTRGLGATGSDGRFAIFPTMPMGICALAKNLIAYQVLHGINTVRGAINRWAPPNENHTSGYVDFVCGVLGCKPDDQFDFKDRNFLFWMITGIGEEENGIKEFNAAVTDADIDAGINLALGGP